MGCSGLAHPVLIRRGREPPLPRHGPTVSPATAARRATAHTLVPVKPTYPEVGATRGELPAGYRHLERHRTIGHGSQDFERAADAVMRWGVQRGAGLRINASSGVAAEGVTVTVRLGVGQLAVQAPCVVVYTVDAARGRGFAYGTLPSHPERGEELFLVEHWQDDTVRLTIRALSRPALWWSRAAGPAARLVQRLVTARYLRALDG